MHDPQSSFSESPIPNSSLTFVGRLTEDDVARIRHYCDQLVLGWLLPWPIAVIAVVLTGAGV